MNEEAPQGTDSRYQVITRLGRGGMAQVLLVLARSHAGINKLLVVKELLAELREDPEFVAMFLDEARLAVRLNHPNVIQTYEVDDSRAHPSIVMEYLEGQSLGALLNRVGRDKMPLELHLYILAQAAAGLHYAHELCDFDGTPLGVVHRDVSPHNLFVTYDGQVKVVDFGIAKVANSARKTAIGVFKGKVNYASAEQILGERVDHRSDVFTLGILLWEALARQRLSFREPEGEVMQRRIKGIDPTIRSVAPETPDDLARICDRAMQRSAADRFESADAFRVALETHLETSKRVGGRELGELIRKAFAQERSEIRRQIDERLKTLAHPDRAATGTTEPPPMEGPGEVSSKGTSARLSLSVETELTPPPRPAAPRRRLAVAGLAVMGLGLLGLGMQSQRGRDAAPAASTPVASVTAASSALPTVSVSLAVSPADARLYLDGVALATNPFRVTVPREPRSHRVSASAPGFAADEQLVVFDQDVTLQLTLRPLPAAPEAASAASPTRRPGRAEGWSRAPQAPARRRPPRPPPHPPRARPSPARRRRSPGRSTTPSEPHATARPRPTMTLRTSLAALVVAGSLLSHQAVAQGDPVAQGKAHFTSAVALFREGDYRAALVEFRRSYELSHNYRVLYNIGQAEFEVQDYAGALRSFQRYLAEGGAEIEAERRTAVEADIKRLSTRVARLTLKVNLAGAEVLIDDVSVGHSPLKEPLVVSAGRRRLTVQKADVPPVTRFLDLAGGDATTVTIDLALPVAAATSAPVALPPPSPPPPPPPPSRTGFWISLSATGALAIAATTTGILALRAHSDTETKLKQRGVSASAVESAHNDTATLALATDVLGGAAIAMGVVTLLLGTSGGSSSAGDKPGVALSVGPQGAFLNGRF